MNILKNIVEICVIFCTLTLLYDLYTIIKFYFNKSIRKNTVAQLKFMDDKEIERFLLDNNSKQFGPTLLAFCVFAFVSAAIISVWLS